MFIFLTKEHWKEEIEKLSSVPKDPPRSQFTYESVVEMRLIKPSEIVLESPSPLTVDQIMEGCRRPPPHWGSWVSGGMDQMFSTLAFNSNSA